MVPRQSPGPAPRITSLLVKPASAVCSLDCEYCFYLDRGTDPYEGLPAGIMTSETLEQFVDGYLIYPTLRRRLDFQGGEPTLAGLAFFQKLVDLQKRLGRNGLSVSNSIQTNGIMLDSAWCELFVFS